MLSTLHAKSLGMDFHYQSTYIAQYSTVQYEKYITVHFIVQYNTVQYSTVQYSTVPVCRARSPLCGWSCRELLVPSTSWSQPACWTVHQCSSRQKSIYNQSIHASINML